MPYNTQKKKILAKSGLKKQSNEELAQSHTTYKVILSCERSDFPYVNVTSSEEKIENNLSSFYDIAEKRDKAIKHLKSLCTGAKKIVIYASILQNKPKKH